MYGTRYLYYLSFAERTVYCALYLLIIVRYANTLTQSLTYLH